MPVMTTSMLNMMITTTSLPFYLLHESFTSNKFRCGQPPKKKPRCVKIDDGIDSLSFMANEPAELEDGKEAEKLDLNLSFLFIWFCFDIYLYTSN